MPELTATVAETRANFSKIASTVNKTGSPVTVFKNSKPWVMITPVSKEYGSNIPNIDWNDPAIAKPDPVTGVTVVPIEWDDPEDDGLYDDLV